MVELEQIHPAGVFEGHVDGPEPPLAYRLEVDYGPSGTFPTSTVMAADSAADQRHAATHQASSPATSLLPSLTAPQNSDRSRSSSTAVSPISAQESATVLDPRWGGIPDSLEAAWDWMGTSDTLPRGTSPTDPVAAGLGSAASGEGRAGTGRLQARSGNRSHRRFRLDSLPQNSQLALRSAPAGPREKSAEEQKEEPDPGQPLGVAVAAKEVPRGQAHQECAEEEEPEAHDSPA